MDAEQSGRVVRARQRSRTALRSFSVPLNPIVEEIGVDRMQVGVFGSWQLNDVRPSVGALTPETFKDAFFTLREQHPWFRKPSINKNGLELLTIKRSKIRRGPTSLGSTRVFVSGLQEGQGKIEVSISCNPTETLAHLLTFAHEETDFLSSLHGRSPFGFFQRYGVRPSLDSAENWLPDVDLARRLLGRDIFGTFLPIFTAKLMQLVANLVAPIGNLQISEDGTDQVIEGKNLVARLRWGKAMAPQIETYFERHHSEARSTVRAVAQTILASLDETRVRHHLHQSTFERQEDLFSIRTKIAGERDFKFYAKAPDRLRFEVVRPKRGRYPSRILLKPEDRLLQIFDGERNDLPGWCDWDAVAGLFEEPRALAMSDLVALTSLVADACAAAGVSALPIFEALLVDSGATATLEDLPENVIQNLCKRGVLERVSVRKRDTRGERRFTLAPTYRWLVETVRTSLAANISPPVSP